MLYINPYRRTKDGRPYYQKSRPRLKSAFADRRKRRIHSRAEFAQREVVAHVGNAWIVRGICDGRKNPFSYSVFSENTGAPSGCCSLVAAFATLANFRNTDVFNREFDDIVEGAEFFGYSGIPLGIVAEA